MSKNNLKKMFLVYPSSFNKINTENQDTFFISKRLLPILLNNELKENYKWYQIRQQLLQYAHLKRNASRNLKTEIKNSKQDNSTQTKFLFKKEKSVQFAPEAFEKSTGTEPMLNEEVYETDFDENAKNMPINKSRKRTNQAMNETYADIPLELTLSDYASASQAKPLKKTKEEKGYQIIQNDDGTVDTIFHETVPKASKRKYKWQNIDPTDRILRHKSAPHINWVNLKQ